MQKQVTCSTLAALMVLTATAADARQAELFRAGTVSATAHVGGTAFTDFLRTVETHGGSQTSGVRRLSAKTTGSAGLALAFAPGRHWAIRLQGAWAPSRFDVIHPASPGGSGPVDAAAARQQGADEVHARLHTWTADLAILFHLPLPLGSTAAYGVAGAGAAGYRARPAFDSPLPGDAVAEFAAGPVHRAVGVLGAGVRVPLAWRDTRLSFEIASHFGTPPVQAADPEEAERHEDRVAMASQLRFQLGLSMPLFNARGLDGASPAVRR